MKKFTNLKLKRLMAPLVFFLFFFALIINANGQTLTPNRVTAPAKISNMGAFAPGVLVGTDVTFNKGTSKIPGCSVIYSWESASDQGFTKDVVHNLASTRDFNPGTISKTTYFRRVVSSDCPNEDFGAKTITAPIKITIN
jgi:hypothetical protein